MSAEDPVVTGDPSLDPDAGAPEGEPEPEPAALLTLADTFAIFMAVNTISAVVLSAAFLREVSLVWGRPIK